jgi:uncharacterized membrane protein YdjX (TVP38/TMEM64 family)
MWRRTLILVMALGAALLVMSSDGAHSIAQDAVGLGEGLIEGYPRWGMPLFLVLSAGSAMLAFFSSLVLVPVAVSAWGEWTTLLLVWLGWLLGGVLSYAIGRYVGRRVLDFFLDRERLDYFEQRLGAQAGFLVILIFQLAMPSEIPGYVLGAMRYRFGLYALALGLAELPYAVSGVFLAESFLRREYSVLIALGLALVALVVWAYSALRRTFDSEGRS